MLVHPAVAPVERILAAASSAGAADDARPGHDVAVHALWICACVTVDDAPTWLIHDTPDGRLVWCRVPDGAEPLERVDAHRSAGGHADPDAVLRWLRGALRIRGRVPAVAGATWASPTTYGPGSARRGRRSRTDASGPRAGPEVARRHDLRAAGRPGRGASG